MNEPTGLVIGASGGLGRAILNQMALMPELDRLIAVSRSHPDSTPAPEKLIWLQSDYSEQSIQDICHELAHVQLRYVFICNGVLHNQQFEPEKRLEQVSGQTLQQVTHINAIVPMLWLQGLLPLLCDKTGQAPITLAVLSARIGSIGDNHLGGWYSYRASKAMLNMLLKTLAIELARRAPRVKLLALHPGTTDTALTKPFQTNIRRLFTPQLAARQLLTIVSQAKPDGRLDYLDWQGIPIPW